MILPSLLQGQQHELVRYLKLLLARLVRDCPPLTQDDRVDEATLRAVRLFRMQWYQRVRGDLGKTRLDAIDFKLWAMIGRALHQEKQLLAELQAVPDRKLRSLLLGLNLVGAMATVYTEAMEASDERLARAFGGPKAVAAGNGFEPESLALARFKAGSFPYYRGDERLPDGRLSRGHLDAYAMHLYGSTDGTRFGVDGTQLADLYVPDGFANEQAQIRQRPGPRSAGISFYYPRLGRLKDVTVLIMHVRNYRPVKKGDRWHIGQIGGRGGSPEDSPTYVHSHFDLVRGNVGLTGKRDRIPFAELFG